MTTKKWRNYIYFRYISSCSTTTYKRNWVIKTHLTRRAYYFFSTLSLLGSVCLRPLLYSPSCLISPLFRLATRNYIVRFYGKNARDQSTNVKISPFPVRCLVIIKPYSPVTFKQPTNMDKGKLSSSVLCSRMFHGRLPNGWLTRSPLPNTKTFRVITVVTIYIYIFVF